MTRILAPSFLIALSITACSMRETEMDYDEAPVAATEVADEEQAEEPARIPAETKAKRENSEPERLAAGELDADLPAANVGQAPMTATPSPDPRAQTEALGYADDLYDVGRTKSSVGPAASRAAHGTGAASPAKEAPSGRSSVVVSGVVGGQLAPPPPAPKPADYADKDWTPTTDQNTESYTHYGVNDMTLSESDRLSTFSIDVDTASYTIARRKLQEGALPPAAAVRVEEFVNYFPYDYASPGAESGSAPFAVHLEAAPNPFDSSHHILRVGIKGKDIEAAGRKPMHLTFLVDTSGSMASADKLGLAKQSLAYLVNNLEEEDTVAIATYAGSTQIILKPTPATRKSTILDAIERLESGGGTAMGSGMEMAYQMASESAVQGAENRVIVLSDGDANIGRTSHDEILRTVQQYAEEGITLSTIGFGMGNYKDTMMEQLANKGDGNYYYIDTFEESKKVFGQDLSGTLQVIAKDVKIQVEMNPDAVLAWRLVGYENRDIADQDFRNDRVDAGEVGAGHTVTAIYDVVLKDGYHEELATVRLRAKKPGPDSAAKEWSTSLPASAVRKDFNSASKDFRMAYTAATFAELLRGSPYAAEVTYAQLYTMGKAASRGKVEDQELLGLIQKAGVLSGERGSVAGR